MSMVPFVGSEDVEQVDLGWLETEIRSHALWPDDVGDFHLTIATMFTLDIWTDYDAIAEMVEILWGPSVDDWGPLSQQELTQIVTMVLELGQREEVQALVTPPAEVEPPLEPPVEGGAIPFNELDLEQGQIDVIRGPLAELDEQYGWGLSEDGFYLGMQYIQSILNQTGWDIDQFLAFDQQGQGGITDVGTYFNSLMGPGGLFDAGDGGDGEPPTLGPGGYQPGTNLLPADYRWVTDWGEGNPEIAAFIKKWKDRFQKNHVATGEPGDPKFDPEQMKIDFLYGGGTDPDGGLFDQDWWQQAQGDYAAMAEMWYSYGGPGSQEFVLGMPSAMGFGAPSPDWTGVPNSPWNTIWNDHLRIVNEVIEDLGLTALQVGGEWILDMAGKLMARGGATYHLDPMSRQNWNEEAVQMVERALLGRDPTTPGFFDPVTGQVRTPGITVGSGSITDWENKFRGHAAAQLWDGIDDDQFRKWAVDAKTEQGLNEEQVYDAIDDLVYSSGFWPLSEEEIERMRHSGGTIGGRVSPLRQAATQYTWEDESYPLNDPWLMDHYVVEEDDGTRRFRSAAEMRDVARTNLDRFQHSSKYQDPMNAFITGAAAMFRSDF